MSLPSSVVSSASHCPQKMPHTWSTQWNQTSLCSQPSEKYHFIIAFGQPQSNFDVLEEIISLKISHPRFEISKSPWPAWSERLEQRNVKLTDRSGTHWRPRLRASRWREVRRWGLVVSPCWQWYLIAYHPDQNRRHSMREPNKKQLSCRCNKMAHYSLQQVCVWISSSPLILDEI